MLHANRSATLARACAETLEPRRLLATFTVTTTADSGPGSLRKAIESANSAAGDDVIVFDSTFNANQIINVGEEMAITDALTITGPADASLTLDGQGSGRICNIEAAGEDRIGTTRGVGGGLTMARHDGVSMPTAVLEGVMFENNVARSGAGVASNIIASFRNCTFAGNQFGDDSAGRTPNGRGGGLFVGDNGSTFVSGCTFLDNTRPDDDTYAIGTAGGGILSFGDLEVRDSTFTGNTARPSRTTRPTRATRCGLNTPPTNKPTATFPSSTQR